MSGEFVWECDDLDDTSTQLLTTPSMLSSPVPLPVTLWNQSGIYVLQVYTYNVYIIFFVYVKFQSITSLLSYSIIMY